MKRRVFHIALSLLIICTVFLQGKDDLKATTNYDLNNGSINIITNGSNIDIEQNGITIDTVSPSNPITIISSSTTSNNLTIDITGISEEVTIKLTNVNIDVTGSELAAVDITGSGNIRFEYEGTNSFKSDAMVSGVMANGFSTKSSNGVNLTFAGNGITTFSGYNCGIYLNNGGLTIEDGNITAISKNNSTIGNGIYASLASLTINGGEIYAEGNANGLYADKTTIINGGVINTVGRTNRGMHAVSNLVINGGILNATGPSIGIQANSGIGSYTKINGGTIITKAQNSSNDWVFTTDKLTVNGGTIQGSFPSNVTPKNENGVIVYLNTLILENASQTLITDLTIDTIDGVISNATGLAYGINDVYSDTSGNLYFYLREASDKQITVYDETSTRYQNTFDRISNNSNIATLYTDKTITFYYQDNDGNQNITYTIGYSDTFNETKPTFINPKGYIFDDWYTSLSGTEIFDFTQAITTNQSVYAQYTPITLELIIPLLPDATVGNYYSTTLPKAIGGVPNITYEVTNLPEGLVFNSDTLEISGIPVSSGEVIITYTATDSHTTAQSVSVSSTLKILKQNDDLQPPITDDMDNDSDKNNSGTIPPSDNNDSDTSIIGKPSIPVTNNSSAGSTTTTSPTTGDTTNVTALFALLGVTTVMFISYGFYRKKKNR